MRATTFIDFGIEQEQLVGPWGGGGRHDAS